MNLCMNGMSQNYVQMSNYTENNLKQTTKAIEIHTHIENTTLYTNLKFAVNNDTLNFGEGRRLD